MDAVNLCYIFVAFGPWCLRSPGLGCVFREGKVVVCAFCDSHCHCASAIPHLCLWRAAGGGGGGAVLSLLCAREMLLLFISMNGHMIYLERAKHQQVLMQAASKSSQQTV